MTKKYEDYTREQLLEEIKKLKKQKKFGLVWEEKTEEVVEQCKTNFPVLHEISERAISGNDSPTHLILEGDNYHSLSVLNVTHKGKIDVIYIDPPYNTGNKDFKYNDSFVDKEDSFRHSKWLSFMNKRLKLAKELLSEKGVIFISIDDNEQANLKLLCDTIFGEDNFIGNICWFKKRKGSFLSNNLVSLTEYVLAYKKGSGVKLFGGETDNSESQPIVKRTNSVKTLKFPANFVKTKLKDGVYTAGKYGSGTTSTILISDIKVENKIITTECEIEAPFTWTQSFLDSEIKNGTEVLINTNNLQPRVIRRNNNSFKAMPSFIDGREITATNEDAYELLKDIFKIDRPFSYSKPVNFIKKLINSVSYFNDRITVLDFFAGSGTTAHATLEINANENKKIQFILCTNNENNICEEVTYPRIKTVITGQRPDGTKYADGIPANVRYFKTDFVAKSEDTDENRIRLTNRCYELLQIKESCYDKQNPKVENLKIWRNEGKLLAVIFDRYDNTEDKKYISEIMRQAQSSDEIVVYRFSIDGNLDMDISALPNARLEEIPEEILKTFNQIFKTKKKRK